jgi:hypothetical protein
MPEIEGYRKFEAEVVNTKRDGQDKLNAAIVVSDGVKRELWVEVRTI